MTKKVLEAELAKIDARIERGVKWLDSNSLDWLQFIRATRLDMTDVRRCVVGQVFGNFKDKFDDNEYPVAVRLGFHSPKTLEGLDPTMAYFSTLNAAWEKKVEALRKERTAAQA